MKIVVGLGNPGVKYVGNRHNVGFMVLDELMCSGWVKKHKAEVCRMGDVLLVKPMTFMNLCGESVGEIVRFYKVPTDDVLLVYDDIDTEFGLVRFRQKGSSGGHNGLKSIFQHLGTEEISRIKIGVGRPPGRMAAADYVLQDFSKAEHELLMNVIASAIEKVKVEL